MARVKGCGIFLLVAGVALAAIGLGIGLNTGPAAAEGSDVLGDQLILIGVGLLAVGVIVIAVRWAWSPPQRNAAPVRPDEDEHR